MWTCPYTERVRGLEPLTYSLGSCRSTTELHPRMGPLYSMHVGCQTTVTRVWNKSSASRGVGMPGLRAGPLRQAFPIPRSPWWPRWGACPAQPRS